MLHAPSGVPYGSVPREMLSIIKIYYYQAQIIEKRTLCRCEKRSDEAISPFSAAQLSLVFSIYN
jgi:hypothetical protein